jgi:hypothetical protein
MQQACTGAMQGDGRPAFACDNHLTTRALRSLWIVGWADFIVQEGIQGLL